MTGNEDLRQRRLTVLQEHFESEVDHEFDRTVATFAGHPRYEIMATGQVYDGDDEVIAYHQSQRAAFPDQHQEQVRHHFADDDTVISEFDLVGTNLGEFYGQAATGKAFRVPVIVVFFFDGERITNERIYLDIASLLAQIGRTDLLALASSGEA